MLGIILLLLRKYYLSTVVQSIYGTQVTATIKAVPLNNDLQFFTLPILDINFGLLLAGIIIILVAWIMDEGRKIQEEQELTV